MSGTGTAKPLPTFGSDEEAERFLELADLSEYDLSQLRPMRFEYKAKDRTVSMRMPEDLLAAVKQEAAREGIPYQRFIRRAIERALTTSRTATGRP